MALPEPAIAFQKGSLGNLRRPLLLVMRTTDVSKVGFSTAASRPVHSCRYRSGSCVHQSSPHPSSLDFVCDEAGVFFMALVPMLLFVLDDAPPDAPAPKVSQKSLRSGSPPLAAAAALALSSWPSTNLLNDSAAPLAPVCRPLPAVNAALRACAAKSEVASCPPH